MEVLAHIPSSEDLKAYATKHANRYKRVIEALRHILDEGILDEH